MLPTKYTERQLICFNKAHILTLLRGRVPNVDAEATKERLIALLLDWQAKQEKTRDER